MLQIRILTDRYVTMRRSIYYILFLAILPLFCFSAKLKSGFVKVRVAQWNIGQLSMGKKALESLIEDGHAEVCCHFCGEKYQFSEAELAALLQAGSDEVLI